MDTTPTPPTGDRGYTEAQLRIRLSYRAKYPYLSVHYRPLVFQLRRTLEDVLRREICKQVPGVEISLDDIDVRLGDHWTPYETHDEENPGPTGYRVDEGVSPLPDLASLAEQLMRVYDGEPEKQEAPRKQPPRLVSDGGWCTPIAPGVAWLWDTYIIRDDGERLHEDFDTVRVHCFPDGRLAFVPWDLGRKVVGVNIPSELVQQIRESLPPLPNANSEGQGQQGASEDPRSKLVHNGWAPYPSGSRQSGTAVQWDVYVYREDQCPLHEAFNVVHVIQREKGKWEFEPYKGGDLVEGVEIPPEILRQVKQVLELPDDPGPDAPIIPVSAFT